MDAPIFTNNGKKMTGSAIGRDEPSSKEEVAVLIRRARAEGRGASGQRCLTPKPSSFAVRSGVLAWAIEGWRLRTYFPFLVWHVLPARACTSKMPVPHIPGTGSKD